MMKNKVARDPESEEMLDIVFDSRVYDIGYVFGFGGLPAAFQGMTVTKNINVAGMFARVEKATQKAIDRFMKQMDEGV